MNQEQFLELIDRWLEDDLTPAQFEQLGKQLRESSECRRQFREAVRFHGLMHVAANSRPDTVRRQQSVSSRRAMGLIGAVAGRWPIFSTLVGVMVGIGCASITWAFVAAPVVTKSPIVANLIDDGGFESQLGPLPSFFPDRTGVWSGDESEVVNLDWAAGGHRVLRALHTRPSKRLPLVSARSCDIYRIVDLRPLTKSLRGHTGEPVLELSARFATDFDPGQEQIKAGCHLLLFDGNVPLDSGSWPVVRVHALSNNGRYVVLNTESKSREWNTVSIRTAVPSDAEFAVVRVNIERMRGDDSSFALGKQYIDDVRLSLLPPWSL